MIFQDNNHIMPIKPETYLKSVNYVGLSNNIKNFLSILRIKQHIICNNILIDVDNNLNTIFDLSTYETYLPSIHKNIYIRNSWRFAIFDSDKNLDKIINNYFSLLFQDFNEYIFFKNFKNNCIDFIYRPDLLHDIYINYSTIFNEIKIKDNIHQTIELFSKKYFNKNTISIHLRSWVDCPERQKHFNIDNFYNKISEFNNGINTFFISSDDKVICNNIKKKFGDVIITYESTEKLSIINDLIELMLLSKNNILFGSYMSTFTEMAYIINYSYEKQIYMI